MRPFYVQEQSYAESAQERKKPMVTVKSLYGKPYAGNPHVRFDEVEVASAVTPRRGALLNKKTILTMLSAAALAVLNCFAGDDIAEIEAALAREAQSKPRLKAAIPKLLSATGVDTYWATGELNVTKGEGSIVLKFNIPKAYAHVSSVELTMNAYDVDYPVSNERDLVYFNGTQLGRLRGGNNVWNENPYSISGSLLRSGENTLRIDVDVDNGGWVTRIEWAKLVVDGVVDYIGLWASHNYDDKIHLEWKNVSSGLSGARYYVDRRRYPTEQFKCLNKDNPTREMQYDDIDGDCLPGVNYYYRVRSESGIESNEDVGKRVAKTVEPKFQFTLTGTDWPSTRGINNEADVLVAGHVLKCVVTAEGAPQNVSIKRIELIGSYIGGTKSGNDHKIVWSSNGETLSVSSYLKDGWVIGITWSEGHNGNNGVGIMAALKSGTGYHGKYSWKIKACEYEMAGKVYKASEINDTLSKNVYFDKFGVVDGTPNWYTYWKADGACPGLNSSNVHYVNMSDSGSNEGLEIFIGGGDFCRTPYRTPEEILKVQGMIFKRQDIPMIFFGIYDVEAIVTHEIQHIATYSRYLSQLNAGKRDQDKTEYECAVQTGYGLCVFHEKQNRMDKCDHIVDDDEENGFEIVVGRKEVTIPANFLNKEKVDTYGVRRVERAGWWEYGGYGDDEILSRIAECLGFDNADPKKDWAYPGELAGDIPPEASPSYRGKRMLSATPKSSSKLQSFEPQSNTDLIITINSIAVDMQRDQNSVTGIVYTIGTSIQGDELVDFNGYLVDAQSNVVATAFSAANAESESVELFFDSRNIFDNYNGGPLTLGRVDLTVDGNYSTNNAIGTLYDFAVEPIEVNKSELLCNKGYILDGTTTNDVSAAGIAVSIPVLVNVADDYRLEAELVNTNDELVATAFSTNYCATGTNVFALTFSSDAIYQNGRSGIHAVKNVQLWCGDEMIDANAIALELTESRDIADFVPAGVSVVVDSSSGRFLEPAVTPDGKLSSVQFVFDVTNATDTMVGYDVVSVLMNTNSEIVATIRTAVAVTNGLNQIEITIPASTIAKAGVNGPYRFESIELLPQGESSCGTTYRPSVLSAAYMASDFGTSAIEPCGTPRLVDTTDRDRLTVEYSYEALRVGRVIEEVVLTYWNGDFAARVAITNDVAEVGVKTNRISIASDDVAGGVTNSPYSVGCLSLTPDIIGESPVYMDTGSLTTNIFWQVASPVFAPATKTVFFRSGQPVAISCATTAAEIRYTLDGSEPTVGSALYEGSLVVSNSVTVKAKAFVEGLNPSETVEAEYVRAAIVGANLVQNTSPGQGVPQTLSIPAPGTYRVSFDYTQGGDVELYMMRDGVTNRLSVVSATTAGSTNFLFDVAAAGDYELVASDVSSGVSHVANLSVSISEMPDGKGIYWIYETEETYGLTGTWLAEHGFQNGKMPVDGTSTFTPYTQSDGRFVTIVSTVEFDSALEPSALSESNPDLDDKATITLGRKDDDTLTFVVLTLENGARVWKTVGAQGLARPMLNTPYTIKVTLDCTNRTYSVDIIGEGDVEFTLTRGTTNEFAFAGQQDTAVGQVDFEGPGNVMSLLGNYKSSDAEFMRGDVLQLVGGQSSQALTEGQAAWLNSMRGYDVVKAKVSTMELADFNDAYLLNLDISQSEFGLGMFKVTGIEVTEDEVRIAVTLNRAGAIQVSHGGTSRDAPINGLLKLYGGETPSDRTLLNATVITDDSFSSGDTEVFTYPRSGPARFFCPAIVSP